MCRTDRCFQFTVLFFVTAICTVWVLFLVWLFRTAYRLWGGA